MTREAVTFGSKTTRPFMRDARKIFLVGGPAANPPEYRLSLRSIDKFIGKLREAFPGIVLRNFLDLSRPIRHIVIVDDYPSQLATVKGLFDMKFPGIKVEATNPKDSAKDQIVAQALEADLVILDHDYGLDFDGRDLAEALQHSSGFNGMVIANTNHLSINAFRFAEAGAHLIVEKSDLFGLLLSLLNKI